MASTNKTTNYELSQFIATDKPAWLGDYNQDMSKIDTQMKANATSASTNATAISGLQTSVSGISTDLGTAQGDITSLGTRMTAVETKNTEQDTAISGNASDITSLQTRMTTVESGQSTQGNAITSLQTDVSANTTAIAGNTSEIASTKSELNGFESKFNLTPTTITSISGYNNAVQSANLTLAQSSDSSFFKFYGRLTLKAGSSSNTYSSTPVDGLTGYYGIDTGLVLNDAPDEAYLVSPAGIAWNYQDGQKIEYISGYNTFAVGTNGHIYARVSTNATTTVNANFYFVMDYIPCLYINKSFGDTPEPEPNA